MVERGEIWWLEEPDARRRPYLVLTRNEGVTILNQLLAVPATRTIRDIPTEVRLGPADGMPAECVLSLDNLRLVRKSLLTRRVATVSDSKMREVCEALGFATAC